MKKITGKDIIEAALKNLDVPYCHRGRSSFGLDCAGLIIKTLNDLDIDTSFDMKVYSGLPDGQSLMRICLEQCNIKQKKNFQDGDVLLFKFLNNPQHLGFFYRLNNEDFFIHAYGVEGVKKVVLTRLDEKWLGKMVNSFSFKFLE